MVRKIILAWLILLIITMIPIHHASQTEELNGPDPSGDQQLVAFSPVDVPLAAFDIVSASLSVDHETSMIQGTITLGDNIYTGTSMWYEFQWRLQVYQDSEVWDYTISILVHGVGGTTQVVQSFIAMTTPAGDVAFQINDTSINENTVSFSAPVPPAALYIPSHGSWYFYYHVYAHDGISWDSPEKFTVLDEGEVWKNWTTSVGSETTTSVRENTDVGQPGEDSSSLNVGVRLPLVVVGIVVILAVVVLLVLKSISK